MQWGLYECAWRTLWQTFFEVITFDTAPLFRCMHQCNGVFMKGHECAWRTLWQTFLEVITFDTAPLFRCMRGQYQKLWLQKRFVIMFSMHIHKDPIALMHASKYRGQYQKCRRVHGVGALWLPKIFVCTHSMHPSCTFDTAPYILDACINAMGSLWKGMNVHGGHYDKPFFGSHNAPIPCTFDTAPYVWMQWGAWGTLWQTFLEVIMHPLHALLILPPMFRCKHEYGVFMKGHECAWRTLWQTFLEVIMHPLHAPFLHFLILPLYLDACINAMGFMKGQVCGGHYDKPPYFWKVIMPSLHALLILPPIFRCMHQCNGLYERAGVWRTLWQTSLFLESHNALPPCTFDIAPYI